MANQWDPARKALLAGSTDVPATSFWNRVCQDEGIGQRQGKRWHFSSGDLTALRTLITRETGTDPLIGTLPQDRMSQARQASDEKLARTPVFSELLLLAKREGAIVMHDGTEGRTPAGTCLAVPAAKLNLLKERQIIVVENGYAIQQWDQVMVPESWRHALWCYRGHGRNVRHLRTLLQQHTHLQVAWFCDLDPAGLVMAMHDQWRMVVPEQAVSQSFSEGFLNKHNKLSTFFAQQLLRMPITEHAQRAALWHYVQSHQIAITQEALIATRANLIIV